MSALRVGGWCCSSASALTQQHHMGCLQQQQRKATLWAIAQCSDVRNIELMCMCYQVQLILAPNLMEQ
jgi:hypothetical protein